MQHGNTAVAPIGCIGVCSRSLARLFAIRCARVCLQHASTAVAPIGYIGVCSTSTFTRLLADLLIIFIDWASMRSFPGHAYSLSHIFTCDRKYRVVHFIVCKIIYNYEHSV